MSGHFAPPSRPDSARRPGEGIRLLRSPSRRWDRIRLRRPRGMCWHRAFAERPRSPAVPRS
ncbi:MAG: hypothetical protein C4523_05435 [Myxococcales bacterium]|nr:MAG: hypothetical protein C4523_05435 [Myxococcales bacterium]